MQQKGIDFGGAAAASPRGDRRRALTVSELTDRIQGILETEFLDVWVEGEISNLKFMPSSGHYYFSLKDDKAQIKAVVWRSDARYLKFKPKDGMKVVARGQLRVYAPRGDYQISVQLLEPLGKGSLQQAFEELKERLGKEGLFAPERKRPLPLLPRRIGVVTSPTGAVIRDILRVLRVRYANLEVVVYPCRVQGPEASGEIMSGIHALNRLPGLDVLILARGGGSLEDLWPFNEEQVARALATSRVPTISAVGHETDYTIADFVADLRAPTPSAAAERVVQAKADLATRIANLEGRLHSGVRLRITRVRARVESSTSHRVFTAERGRVRTFAQRVDDLLRRSETAAHHRLTRSRDGFRRLHDRLEAFRLDRQLQARRERLSASREKLRAVFGRRLEARRASLSGLAGKLETLSPLSVLSRGYALVWDASGQRLLRRSQDTAVGDDVRIRLHDGSLRATITADISDSGTAGEVRGYSMKSDLSPKETGS
jgi:exodeoxyribonuclease VII large subunit